MKKIVLMMMIGLLCFSTLPLFTLRVKASEVTSYSWFMLHHDLKHTGFSPSPAPSTNDILWTFQTGDRIVASPAVANGTVFVGSMDKKLYAVDQSNSNLRWNTTLDNYPMFVSPAVEGNKVFVTDESNAYALNETTGAILWKRNLGGSTVFSSPAVSSGMVLVASYNVYALEENSGNVIWNYSGQTGSVSSPAVADGMVFVSSLRWDAYSIPGKLVALNQSNGKPIWSLNTGDGSFVTSPAVLDGMVFAGLDNGTIIAVNEHTGSVLWKAQTGDSVYSSPAAAYGRVYVGSYDGKIYAFDEFSGKLNWTYTTMDRVESSSPAVADGKVFVGSDDNNVYALDAATGTKIWNYTTGHWIESSPAIADGVVYVGSMDGKLYAFGKSEFNISSTPSTRIVSTGSSTTYTAKATLLNGTAQQVSWSASGLPPGATYSFTPPEGYPTFSSTLKITTAKSTPPGTYTITITGTGQSVSHSTTVTLKVCNLTASPTPFSPNGDGVKDTTTINATFWAPVSWTAVIKNSTGAVIRSLRSGKSSTMGEVWDGKDDGHTVVPDGVYKAVLTGPGFSKTISVTVDDTPPSVTCFWHPNPFNPHTGQTSTLNYTLSEKCSININLYYSNGTLAKTLQKPTTKNAGTYTITWNGKNNAGKLVPAGTYTCRIYVTDMAGNDVNPPTGYVTCTVTVQ